MWMRNSTYWKKQFALLEQMQNQKGLQCYAQIDKQYRTVQKQMEGQIRIWYQRFAEPNGVNLQEARRMLTNRERKELKSDLNEYIRYGKENAVNSNWQKQLEHISGKSHISRLDSLKLQMQQSVESMFASQQITIDSAMQEIYQSGYYHTAFELQKGIGVGWKIAALDEGKIAKVMQKPWAADGKNFSERAFVDGDTSGLQKTNLDEEHAIIDFTQSRKQYDEHVQKLAELEKQSEEIFHAYMEAMDASEAIDLQQALNEKYDEIESVREIIKDMKAGLSGKEAKAVRKLEKDLAIKAGIPIDKVKMTGLPYDTAHIIYNSYKTVLNKYPELKGNLAAFSYDGVRGRAYASCRTLTGEIKAHRLFANYDNLCKTYARDVANGFHPVGTDHRGIIVHELGHALDGYMTNQGLLGGKRKSDGKIETTSEIVKDMTLKLLGFNRQEIEMELKNQGLTYIQRCDILEQRERDFITQHISKYAAKNEKEFFAECFAEYMTSENPREAATIFGAIIERALGR